MSIGPVTKFNQLESILFSNSGRQWDDVLAGSCMFILCDNTYVFDATHTTASNLLGVITVGDGSPVPVQTPTLDAVTTPGTTFYNSLKADFGLITTITAKFLLCVQTASANVFLNDGTTKLLFIVDLDDINSTASKVSAGTDFFISPPSGGWFKTT